MLRLLMSLSFPFFLLQHSISLPTLYFLLSISSCHSSCESFQVRTGLWVWTALTCVMATTGKRMYHWSSSHTMQELTVGSRSPLPTLRPFHRTKLHRWVSLGQVQHFSSQKNADRVNRDVFFLAHWQH